MGAASGMKSRAESRGAGPSSVSCARYSTSHSRTVSVTIVFWVWTSGNCPAAISSSRWSWRVPTMVRSSGNVASVSAVSRGVTASTRPLKFARVRDVWHL
jgi:hypothetical protein